MPDPGRPPRAGRERGRTGSHQQPDRIVVREGLETRLSDSLRTALDLADGIAILVGIQLVAGFVNVILLAPVWMQVVHLLLADLVWIVAVLTCAASLAAWSASPGETMAQPSMKIWAPICSATT